MPEELPVYDAAEQGMDQDRDSRAESTMTRAARHERSVGGKHALIAQLNDRQSSLATLVGRLRHPLGLAQQTTDHLLRIAIYLRVSTEEQAKMGGEAEGYSIPYQRDACLTKVQQLGGILVAEYVDAGESAKSADRPALQKMLRELKTKRIDYVIVHKIDRLARNRADDVTINTLILKAGAKLISVAEPVDDSPSGKLLYSVMAGVAQYHSDNLAVEVLKGMDTKAKRGGTPYRAPLGYLNRKEFIDNARHSYVVMDEERAPLIRWAFEQYALGDWSLARLVVALNEMGLRTRATPKRPEKPITLNTLNHILRNPYYFGVVPYRGVYHEGKHEPLITADLWLRAQDVLTAHNLSGDKERIHHHYLKGSIFCGECGARLVFTRNRGRGGVYDYYDCLSKKTKRKPCTRRVIRVEKIEAGVARFYSGFQLRRERIELIRSGVLDELNADREQAVHDTERARRRLLKLQDERQKLLTAHYAGAVPLDMLKSEMDRLTTETAAAERTITEADKSVANLNRTLEAALFIAGQCERQYIAAPPRERRMLNQGLFKALYIGQDGDVERVALTEPFATLLSDSLLAGSVEDPEAGDSEAAAKEVPGVGVPRQMDRSRPSAVLVNSFTCPTKTDETDGDADRLGLHKSLLVPPVGFEPTLYGF